jgi:alpha-2-macroglobulin
VIEDLLPAGLEPVDARLKNVDPALKERLEADRVQAAQKQPGGAYFAPWYRWYYTPWQQVDMRDDRAVLYAGSISKGVYEYVYYARATTPGNFFVAPAHAEETYFPEVFGRSDSSRFVVTP